MSPARQSYKQPAVQKSVSFAEKFSTSTSINNDPLPTRANSFYATYQLDLLDTATQYPDSPKWAQNTRLHLSGL
jgi:hypothetical protein